ncbi:hypothetical protein Rhow_005288 [Rhodococcus wratislaviensis]|uniref:Uncharacterized protein n=1 Tax=Rhodococcus wratislaviensis TaxID=44752 RepID=A0A402CDF7_RHOWR|nr:hypothetical protein Rhow_005288 [Rhodococcus wratislaviensis]
MLEVSTDKVDTEVRRRRPEFSLKSSLQRTLSSRSAAHWR